MPLFMCRTPRRLGTPPRRDEAHDTLARLLSSVALYLGLSPAHSESRGRGRLRLRYPAKFQSHVTRVHHAWRAVFLCFRAAHILTCVGRRRACLGWFARGPMPEWP